MGRRFIFSLVTAAFVGTLAFGAVEARDAADASNKFGFDLFKTVQKRTEKGNKFLSPLSAYLALSMALNGASGETLAEMERTLQVTGLNREDLNAANLALHTALVRDGGDVRLALANSLWAREGFALKQSFVERVGRSYQARLSVLDFALPTASRTINDWVKAATFGRIESIVEERLPADLALLLVNATYFKAKWRTPFLSQSTRNHDFTVTDAKGIERKVSVPAMTQEARFRYLATAQYEAIELPYGKSGSTSMIVLLPAQGTSHLALEKGASAANWLALTRALDAKEPALGTVQLPKIELKYEETLNASLQSLGMSRAFTNAAQFTELTEKNVALSKVLQKTFVGVNEEGTEAAAVTSVGVVVTSIPQYEFQLKVNRPYLFAIRDNATNAILFLGSITEPEGGKLPQR